MAKTFTQSKLQELLQEVPEDIKDWIGSDKTTNELGKLNDKLGLKGKKRSVIPRTLLRLETKELHPADFINEIAEKLNIGMKSANMIAEEIKEEVLEPIEPSLNQWGVNIDLIEPTVSKSEKERLKRKQGVSKEREFKEKPKKKETPTSQKINQQKKEGESKGKQIPISSSPKSKLKTPTKDTEGESDDKDKPQEKIKPEPATKDTSGEPSESKPFMIHQENNFDQKAEEDSKNKGNRKRKKSFSFSKDGFFDSNKSKKEKESPKAQINTPGGSKKKGGIFGFGGKKEEKERVVHYSDNRTDLSDDGSNKFINLSNLEPASPNNKKRKRKTSPNNTNNKAVNKNQKKSSNVNKQKKRNKGKAEESNSSKNSSFLGNIDEGNVNKKDYKKEDGKNKGNGPHVDGNTVDLSQ